MENKNHLECLHILAELMHQQSNRRLETCMSEQASAYVDINSFNIYNKRFCNLVEKISFENGGESSRNYRNPELKQRRSGVSTVRPAFRLDAVYKVTYDLVAFPAHNYLIRNTLQTARNHAMAYRQILALGDYYKSPPRTIKHCNALPPHIPVLPTLAQFSTAVCQIAHNYP